MTKRKCMPLVHVLLSFVLSGFCCAKSDQFTYFDTEDVGKPDSNVPLIRPWKIVALDPEYAGQWMVAADVDADGVDEILVAHKGGLYNDKGKRIGTFHTPGPDVSETRTKYEKSMLIGDMTGDGIPDVVIATPRAAYIYRNTHGRKPDRPVPVGTEFNFTLY